MHRDTGDVVVSRSISPVWTPARDTRPIVASAVRIASAQRTARAGPSNVASTPSPVLFTLVPSWRESSARITASWDSRSARHARSPRSVAIDVDATRSVTRTVFTTLVAGLTGPTLGLDEVLDRAEH